MERKINNELYNNEKRITFSKVRYIVYDFDGVMTDNKVNIDQNGFESVRVNRGDGLAINMFKKQGVHQLILSTEKNSVVKARANKLQIDCVSGVGDKKTVLLDFLDNRGVELKEVLYVGNDINDLEVMKIVGLAVAPKDAHSKVLSVANIVTEARGGDGVIRELFDIINGESDE